MFETAIELKKTFDSHQVFGGDGMPLGESR